MCWERKTEERTGRLKGHWSPGLYHVATVLNMHVVKERNMAWTSKPEDTPPPLQKSLALNEKPGDKDPTSASLLPSIPVDGTCIFCSFAVATGDAVLKPTPGAAIFPILTLLTRLLPGSLCLFTCLHGRYQAAYTQGQVAGT